MKKIFIAVLACAVIFFISSCKGSQKTGDSSKTSLDWTGSYSGVVPCGDCEGTLTRITLRSDNTYSVQTKYLGKSDEEFSFSGKFEWTKDGSQVYLKDMKAGASPVYYQVGENKLTQLDMSGNFVTGDLAPLYVLKKEGPADLNKYWKLVEVNGAPVVVNEKQKKEPHMILHTQNNKVNGSGGCNNFSGSFELQDNNRIKFSPLAVTKMFCEGAAVTEDLMLKALQNTDSYYLKGDTLQLIRGRMAPLAKFKAVYLK